MEVSSRQEMGAVRRERTREKLLAAAARVVAELGESKASIDDFIRMAGVARGTFYNYYATRKDLLDDLWLRVGHSPFMEIQDACHTLSDPAQRLAAEIRLVIERAQQDPTWGWLVYALSSDRESVTEDLLQYPLPDLEAGRALGRFQFDDVKVAGDFVVGATRVALRACLEGRRTQKYIVSFCILVLKALGLEEREASEIAARPLPRT